MSPRPSAKTDAASDGPRLDLIGLDVSARRGRGRRRIAWPVLVIVLALALGLAALRVELTRMRRALADSVATEQRLLEEQRLLTVDMRKLRDPSGLAMRATELGFVRPERVIDLPAAGSERPQPATPLAPPAETALALGASRP